LASVQRRAKQTVATLLWVWFGRMARGRDSTPATASSLAPSSLTGWALQARFGLESVWRQSSGRPFGPMHYPGDRSAKLGRAAEHLRFVWSLNPQGRDRFLTL
jgi:hypothetical protein